MNDLILPPATAELADSIADAAHEGDVSGAGSRGLSMPSMGMLLSGMSASGAAVFVEGVLADFLGKPVAGFIEDQHGAIASFVSPRLADLAAQIIAEFGEKAKDGK